MKIFEQYRADVETLINQVTADNAAVIAQSVALISRYASLAMENHGTTATAHRDETAAAELVQALNLQPAAATSKHAVVSASTPETVTAVTEAAEDVFKVERKLIGAIAGNRFFTEAAVRELDLADGDTVRLMNDDFGDGTAVTIVDRNRTPDSDHIVRIVGALIEQDNNLPTGYQFIAVKDVHGDVLKLTRDDLPITFLIKETDVNRLGLRAGDIVDLAWHSTDGPEQAIVTWVYKDKQGLVPKQKHVAKPKKKQSVQEQKDAGVTVDSTAKTYVARIPFNLGGRDVLIVGNVTSKTDVELVVAAHDGGQTTATAATKGAQLKHKLARADVAILITDEVHHITTNTSVKIAKSLKVPYAVANNDAPLTIERALYRALTGMPAYESAQSNFTYPEI